MRGDEMKTHTEQKKNTLLFVVRFSKSLEDASHLISFLGHVILEIICKQLTGILPDLLPRKKNPY